MNIFKSSILVLLTCLAFVSSVHAATPFVDAIKSEIKVGLVDESDVSCIGAGNCLALQRTEGLVHKFAGNNGVTDEIGVYSKLHIGGITVASKVDCHMYISDFNEHSCVNENMDSNFAIVKTANYEICNGSVCSIAVCLTQSASSPNGSFAYILGDNTSDELWQMGNTVEVYDGGILPIGTISDIGCKTITYEQEDVVPENPNFTSKYVISNGDPTVSEIRYSAPQADYVDIFWKYWGVYTYAGRSYSKVEAIVNNYTGVNNLPAWWQSCTNANVCNSLEYGFPVPYIDGQPW